MLLGWALAVSLFGAQGALINKAKQYNLISSNTERILVIASAATGGATTNQAAFQILNNIRQEAQQVKNG